MIKIAAGSVTLPALCVRTPAAGKRFIAFFTANIRNANTRRAYTRATVDFAAWCDQARLTALEDIEPVHVAAYIETLQTRLSAPSVKQYLAAIRMLFDWLVVGQQRAVNPAAAVRGPKHSVIGLRDHALISVMVYTFARVGAAIKMRVEDVYIQGLRTWGRLHEKGGKRHEMPCHHTLEASLERYLDLTGLRGQAKAVLFPNAPGKRGELTERPLQQNEVYRMIRRRLLAAGIATAAGCHTFRATGITEYLRNGGKLEVAQQMANHESSRTTGLYGRRNDQGL
ncbi:tyrosine-type recombinase/integrase [Thiocystis violacea]|uniref:tyrosine-type recombinase/integrase n=1 Tax=Thiocystis violacea TaxID=13725 RepID=UPI0019040772|nr:tyrosine-type recombinase/integrase [Thiocystis violacea]